MKILVVEDSIRLGKTLVDGLSRSGYAVDLVGDGSAALQYAKRLAYDVVVLDLMLPKIDGLAVLRELRRSGESAGIIILSARDQVQDRVQGLQLGADDYLVKPFSFDELQARIAALIRRRYAKPDPVIALGSIDFDTARHQAFKSGTELKLTPHESVILECLALNRGRVVSLRKLEDSVYDSDSSVSRMPSRRISARCGRNCGSRENPT
ncbi:MAG: response regulator transcription factor [Gammaproteobacteria bacterium]|nr:response regulator transcription factor [Gammaproteobacteria bacterium]